MEEKRYLKWYNKAGYGCGDIAGNSYLKIFQEMKFSKKFKKC